MIVPFQRWLDSSQLKPIPNYLFETYNKWTLCKDVVSRSLIVIATRLQSSNPTRHRTRTELNVINIINQQTYYTYHTQNMINTKLYVIDIYARLQSSKHFLPAIAIITNTNLTSNILFGQRGWATRGIGNILTYHYHFFTAWCSVFILTIYFFPSSSLLTIRLLF